MSSANAPAPEFAASPPRGPLRAAFRSPVVLYRLGLGRLLGHRFLLLTHLGRRSGQKRQTVLEVVRHNPATHEYVVVSGFGGTADWYRNLLVHPALEISSGGERFRPAQRFLADDEKDDVLAAYEQRHPRAMLALSRLMHYPYDGTSAGRRAMAHALPMVAFRPATEGSAPTA